MDKIYKIDDPLLEINYILRERAQKFDMRKIEDRYSRPAKEEIIACIREELSYEPFKEKVLNNKYTKRYSKSIDSSFRWLLNSISVNGKNENITAFKESLIKESFTDFGSPLKSVLKWVGSKAQLKEKIKEEIQKMIPESEHCIYHEPFLGGGSIAFELTKKYAILSDYNENLIDFYKVVKDRPKELIDLSEKVQEIYNNRLIEDYEKENFYYEYRKNFKYPIEWLRKKDNYSFSPPSHKVLEACQFLFLNKCDFNGLYRVNSSGKFNVPWGQKDQISLISEKAESNKTGKPLNKKNKYKNFWDLSKYLKSENVTLKQMDFEEALSINQLDKSSYPHLFYLDPPYLAEEGKETTFTDYTTKGFRLEDLEEIKRLSDKLIEKGNYVIISNHDNAKIRKLFNDENYIIKDDLTVYRSISGIKENRGNIDELLIIGRKNKK